MPSRSAPWLLVLLALASCDACGKKAPPAPAPPPIDRPAGPVGKPEADPLGVLEGSIRLASPEAPAFTPEELERQVLQHNTRQPWPAECTPPKLADRRPLQLTDDGKLSGVVVAASEFKNNAPLRPPRVHEVVLRDCRLTPSIVLAQQGDTLRVTSEVKFPFMPGYGPPSQIKTLIPGQTYEVPLNVLGAAPITCGFTAPCGRTDVIVLSHGHAALSDEKGNFRIDSFPAGERVRVSAWHPLLNASETEIELAPGETKSIELIVSPAPR